MPEITQPELFGGPPPEPVSSAGAFAEVVFDRPLDHAYTYAVPVELRELVGVGKRVRVPFGRGDRQTIGFCVGLTETAPARPVKEITQVLDERSLLTPQLLQLTRWVADYYLSSWGQVLNFVIPSGVKRLAGTRAIPLIEAVPEAFWPSPVPSLTSKQQAVLDLLRAQENPIEPRLLAQQARCGSAPIKALLDKGLARRKMVRVENVEREALNVERGEGSGERGAPSMERGAQSAQELVWASSYGGPLSALGAPRSTLPSPPSVLHSPFILTSDQQQVWEVLEPAVRGGGFQTFLLHGVTGSGKTEIYLRAIEEVVRQGKEALVLVPEISLTPQTIQAFRERFTTPSSPGGEGRVRGEVAVLHSHLQTAERGKFWRRILNGQAEVVVGARSAVFAPTPRLGLIVIDEEHESSFKEEAAPRYHARDVAVVRARLEKIPIILGSATPSLESWHNARRGQYTLLSLPRRIQDRPLPHVAVLDLRHDRHADRRWHGLSPSLERAMRQALDRGGQVMLLLNRRGFSTYIHCPGCGFVEQCRFCDLSLTFHQERQTMLCHYCGYEGQPPQRCPQCGLGQVRYQGMGTEKLEGEIQSKFPGKVVRRMDSDTTRRPGSHKKILDAFRHGEIHILLGTQMIAKGLDFPNVTLVGVVNADLGLHRPDFRAGERTFQLLAQVAGRTGRGPQGGRVLIQTFTPEHPSIALATTHNFQAFAEAELAQRQLHGYPPFQRMARLVIRAKNAETAEEVAERLAGAFRIALERGESGAQSGQRGGENAGSAPPSTLHALRILGPAEAPVFRLKGYYRFHFQLQSPSSVYLHQVLHQALPSIRLPKNVQLIVDIDPQDMV